MLALNLTVTVTVTLTLNPGAVLERMLSMPIRRIALTRNLDEWARLIVDAGHS